MNADALKLANEKFKRERINEANFIKENSIQIIEDLELEILKLKEQLKKHKLKLKQANKDIIKYSL